MTQYIGNEPYILYFFFNCLIDMTMSAHFVVSWFGIVMATSICYNTSEISDWALVHV